MGANGIYGLSGSGLDIESLVKVGMISKQNQYDKMQQNEIMNTWVKEEWATIYDKYKDYQNALSEFKMQSTMNAHKATSSDSSVVTATANGAAATMTHQVSVNQTATNAYLLTNNPDGGGITRNNTDAKTSDYLYDVIFADYNNHKDADGNYTVNGVKHHEDEVALTINVVDELDEKGDPVKTNKLSYTYKELFEEGKTLSDFAIAFSSAKKADTNLQANYDSANDSFSIYNNSTGKNQVIGLTAADTNASTLLNNLHLMSYDSDSGELSAIPTFTADTELPVTLETKTSVQRDTVSTTLKDVLGVTAKKNSDGNYDITDKDGKVIGTLQADQSNKTDVAFSLKVSNGTDTGTIDFTYEDLFDMDDIGNKKSLDGVASLTTLAEKISNATNSSGVNLGISASYDAGSDTFTMTNTGNVLGSAEIIGTTKSAGGTDSVADGVSQQLVSSLGMVNNAAAKAKNVAIDNNSLADTLGLKTSLLRVGTSYQLTVTNSANETVASITDVSDNYLNSSVRSAKALSFSVDGSANTIDLTYGDLFDFSSLTYASPGKLNWNGTYVSSTYKNAKLSASSFNIEDFAGKINGVSPNVVSSYDSSSKNFVVVNTAGDVEITGSNTATTNALSNLNLANMTISSSKVSSGISRVNEKSTDDDTLAGVLGESSTTEPLKFTVKNSLTGEAKEISVTTGDDLKTLAQKITDATGSTISASYDADTGKFKLMNTKGGVSITGGNDLSSKLLTNLGLEETKESQSLRIQAKGTNAEVTIDGKNYELDKNSKTVAGVTYTFTGKTDPGKKISVAVSQDTEKIAEKVAKFVDSYNELIDYLNDKRSEERYSDYKPLSSTQEDQMTEKQIEKWTEKAKSGLLHHDNTLSSMISQMREALSTPVDSVDGIYNSASSIGITTSNVKGHITLDVDKLNAALAAEPNCVYQIFANDQDTAYDKYGTTDKSVLNNMEKKSDYRNTGIANRLYNLMGDLKKKVEEYAGTSKETGDQSYLGKLITNLQTKMSTFRTQMNVYENLLYKRYDSMEAALQTLGVQMNYVSNYGN